MIENTLVPHNLFQVIVQRNTKILGIPIRNKKSDAQFLNGEIPSLKLIISL